VEAAIGQNFTFTIRVVNSGTGPATNVQLEDSFSAYVYLDIFDLTTTKGTRDINGRVARVNIGTLEPNEVVTVRIVVRVNSSAPSTGNPCNTARITYTSSSGVNSNTQCFRVTGGSSLPPTGEIALEPEGPAGSGWTALFLGLCLGAAGFILLRRGHAARIANQPHARLLLTSGGAAVLLALFAGLAACQWFEPNPSPTVEALITQEPVVLISATPSATLNPLAELPAYMFATPNPEEPLVIETLPSYPIPSPSLPPELAEEDQGPDTSAVRRMEIPGLDLNAVVAYVPFDGQSWKIQGLREEVAWLGDTSWPGLGGNTAFAAHVTVRGLGNGPFRYLNTLLPGDEIRVYTEEKIYIYQVREVKVVEETEMAVTGPTEGSQITLITCVDWNETIGIYLKRLVVIADQVEVTALAR
jgi:LPXTG-site transpeptidase (sortase) family protein